MDNLDPPVPHSHHTQVNQPDVGQAGRDHQASQSLRVGEMASVQVEYPTPLVREEGLNPDSCAMYHSEFLEGGNGRSN
jgi:hypothetical protein